MRYKSKFVCLTAAVIATFFPITRALGQTNSFKQTNLVSDTAGTAANLDPKLVNPWGIAYFPGQPFWIADNNSGFSTTYNQQGVNAGDFVVPAPPGDANTSTPTGIVANLSAAGFLVNGRPALFIFDSEDGTISAWNGVDPVTTMVDKSQAGAVYKGLALVNLGQAGTFLLATDFHSGKVDVYDSSFHESHLIGDLIDPQIPNNYAPFGIHVLHVNGGQEIFITYAMQDQAQHDPVHQAGAGYVDLFDENGGFVQRLASQDNLNAPWGVVIPPNGFGPFGGKVLVGEFGNGAIDIYDLGSGNFIDQLKDANGAIISNGSLWDMVFGGGGASGDPNTLYITAGLANEQHGLFAAITPKTVGAPGADFSIGVNPTTATVTAGQATTFMVTIGGLNGFNSPVTFSCSGQPANSTCSFSPASVTPTSGGNASTTLRLSTTVYVPPRGYEKMGLITGTPGAPIGLLLSAGLLLIGAYQYARKRRLPASTFRFAAASLLLVGLCVLSIGGCGYSKSAATGTPPGTGTMMVTATSGTISHSIPVNLTVNQ